MDELFVYRTIRGRVDLGSVEDAIGRKTNERPRIVRAEDGQEYICKFLDDSGPEVMGSELIAGTIAQHLGLPVPSFAVLHLGDRRTFASLRVARNPIALRGGLLERTENAAIIPDLIAFDILIENRDRDRPGNTIFVRGGADKAKPYRVYTIDHSWSGLRFYRGTGRAPIGPDTLEFTSHPVLWSWIRDERDFAVACGRIAALAPRDLSRIVNEVSGHIRSSRFEGLDQILVWRAQAIGGLVARVLRGRLPRKKDEGGIGNG